MSTIINTNTTAYMASLSLNQNSGALSTDIQRLSTGLQINSAADNPAGLVASEDMQSQLAGLNQATSNSNNAINEIKTAEGALAQVQNLLVSMQQLAVGASNQGANDATEVAADQAQIASAIQSIDQIAATTQYGQKFLLNGNASSGLTTTSGSSALEAGAASGSSIASKGTWTAGTAGTYTSAFTAATTATYTGGGATLGTVGNTDDFSGSIGINGQIYQVAAGSDLTQVNASIAQSGYTAGVTGGALVFTSNGAGAISTPAFDLSNLSDTTLDGSAAGTGDFDNSGAFANGAAASMALTQGAEDSDGSPATPATYSLTMPPIDGLGAGYITASSVQISGTVGINSQAYNVGSSPVSLSSFNTAIAASGYQASVSIDGSNQLTFTATVAGAQGSEPIFDASGLSMYDGLSIDAGAGSYQTNWSGDMAAQVYSDADLGQPISDNLSDDFLHVGAATPVTFYNPQTPANTPDSSVQLTITNGESLDQLNQDLTSDGSPVQAVYSGGSLVFTTEGGATANDPVLTNMVTGLDNAQIYSEADGSLSDGTYLNGSNGGGGGGGPTTTLNSVSTEESGNTDYFTFGNGLVLTAASNTANNAAPFSLDAVSGATTQGQDLIYQIGANQGQISSFGIQSAAADQLGQGAVDSNGNPVATQNVAAINVTTFQGAQDAINVLNTAISQVSTIRANMGAYENNVLQSNVNSLGVAQTNLQSSESTITDTDMASQVVDYTKNSILVQSATQALSFANTMPQYVLKLIDNAG